MKLLILALTSCFLVVELASVRQSPPTVSLYYESLCPGCHDFINSQLVPTFQKLGNYFNVELVAFGNANVEAGDQIHCQHGPDECYGNSVQACLLAQKDTTTEKELSFISCMNNQTDSDVPIRTAAAKCSNQLSLDWNSLSACADGPQGLELILANANKTNSLQPAHIYVPWIVINGIHTEDMENAAQGNLSEYLCVNYLRNENIPQCKDLF